jgi:hypothetical protein
MKHIPTGASAPLTAAAVEARLVAAFATHAALPPEGPQREPVSLRPDDPPSRRNAVDVGAERKSYVRAAKRNRKLFEIMCEADRAVTQRAPIIFNALLLADEAMAWVVEPEANKRVESARVFVLKWLRSGGTKAAFCEMQGVWPGTLAYALATYCGEIAGRLSAAPPPPQVKRRNNSRPKPPRLGDRLEWNAPLAPEARLPVADDIAFGIDEIAAEIGRRPSTALRLIEAGRYPVGEIAGHLCASRTLLRHYGRRPPILT